MVINQEFGKNWAFYNGDCVFVMSGLPSNSINFSIYSPPFRQLYIYSDHIADMGNSTNETEFFEGYKYALRELHRITKNKGYQAIHCKDLMRYMSSNGYSGQDDFPGKIIKLAESEGWTFQRWITIWKNPVVEMQRTKTYGLLHKSFKTRAEVVRQGAPDMILILRKQDNSGEYNEKMNMSELPKMVKNRIKHIWSMKDDKRKQIHIVNKPLVEYTDTYIDVASQEMDPGRLIFIHCMPLPKFHNDKIVGYFDMMGEVISRFEAQGSWKFHTRITLTDGTYLVGFRNWTDELRANYKKLNGQVTHNLKAPKNAAMHEFTTYYKDRYITGAGMKILTVSDEHDYDESETHTEFEDIKRDLTHPDYVGSQPPAHWHDNGYYSIMVWQKYASPVWFDLDELPKNHVDAWMDIQQTNVLNYKAAKDPKDEKHICPLQLDLIDRLILEYTAPDDVIFSPYGGISSEGYRAIKLGRKTILSELKSSYWKQGVKYLKESEKSSKQIKANI